MNLRIITKNLAADSKIGSSLKIDFRADCTHESNPTAWELNFYFSAYVVGCCQGGQLSSSELKKFRIDFNEEKTFFQKKFIRI